MQDSKFDTYDFKIPTWALCAIINGDYSGLVEEEKHKVKTFVEKYGDTCSPTSEEYFSWCNDIDGNLGATVQDYNFIVPVIETANNWFGIDASLEISLQEYNILCRQIGTTDTYECIVKVGNDAYQLCDYTMQEVKDTINESWFRKEGFFSFIGQTEEEFLDNSIVTCLQDMCQYHGPENIFGTCYAYNTLQEINTKFNFDFE